MAFSCFHGDGARDGLLGGHRADGGAANVDNNWRDNRNDSYALRLVLARSYWWGMKGIHGYQLGEVKKISIFEVVVYKSTLQIYMNMLS
jgi:hypothetical protein